MKGLGLKPIKISLEDNPEEWIEIKAKLSRGDADWIGDQIYSYRVQGDADGEFSIKTLNRPSLLLQRAITGWRLFTEDGQHYKFEPERIADLPLADPLVDKVLGEIVDRNPTLGGSRATETE